MHAKRTDTAKELKGLPEELTKSQGVSTDTTLEEELGQIRTLANTDGTKSWLSEVNKWIEAVTSKVREQLILSWRSVLLFHFVCFFIIFR